MRKLNVLLLLFFVMVGLIACEETNPQAFSEGLQVRVGRKCGWCYGQKELTISSAVSSFYYDYACSDSLDVTERFFSTPTKQWTAINAFLSQGDFQSLDLNSCAVCADGCDYWIKVIDVDYEHQITFVNTENIEDASIKELADELIEALNAFEEAD